MNKDNLLALLRSFREQNIICYAYRETVFNALSTDKVDGTLHLITDAAAHTVSEALKANGFKDVTESRPDADNIDTRCPIPVCFDGFIQENWTELKKTT